MTGHRGIRTALALAVLAVSAAAFPHSGPLGERSGFEKDVLPILTASCVKCHGAEKPKAGLDLRTRAGMLKGGESGPALILGSAEKSLLFQMVKKGEMPPKATKLTPEQVAVLRTWIEAGAPSAQSEPAEREGG